MQVRKVDRDPKSLDEQSFTPIVNLATPFLKFYFSVGTADELMIFAKMRVMYVLLAVPVGAKTLQM